MLLNSPLHKVQKDCIIEVLCEPRLDQVYNQGYLAHVEDFKFIRQHGTGLEGSMQPQPPEDMKSAFNPGGIKVDTA